MGVAGRAEPTLAHPIPSTNHAHRDPERTFVVGTQQIDFNDTIGKMIAAVLFGVAEMEQQNRRERQAAGIAAAKESGVYIGQVPGTTKATPSRAKDLRKTGLTDGEIAKALGISRRTVQRYRGPEAAGASVTSRKCSRT